jgi:hypothetical protein
MSTLPLPVGLPVKLAVNTLCWDIKTEALLLPEFETPAVGVHPMNVHPGTAVTEILATVFALYVPIPIKPIAQSAGIADSASVYVALPQLECPGLASQQAPLPGLTTHGFVATTHEVPCGT